MKDLKVKIDLKLIGGILKYYFVGYIVGLLIAYVNVFGTSGNAPLICAMGAGSFGFYTLLSKKK